MLAASPVFRAEDTPLFSWCIVFMRLSVFSYCLHTNNELSFEPSSTRINSKFVRCSYKAPDNTATLNICATKNTTERTAKKVQDNFKSSYPGTVDYENIGSDWCVCRTYKDGMYHYGYFSLKNGMIRGFEMHFDGAYYQTYETYVNYIYDSLSIKSGINRYVPEHYDAAFLYRDSLFCRI